MPKKGQLKKKAKPRSVQQRKYNSKAKQKKNRAQRNAARKKAGVAGKGGKDIDHKKKISKGGSNAKKNLRKRSVKSNRADNGKTGGRPSGGGRSLKKLVAKARKKSSPKKKK